MANSNILEILAGVWAGAGLGEYPTIESFEYRETLRFVPAETSPKLFYEQKTRRRPVGSDSNFVASHWESGFIRPLDDNGVEFANAQIGGRVEVLTGTAEPTPTGLVLRLKSALLANDPRMQESTRTITVEGDTLHYTMYMQTTKVPHLAIHLEATLQRQQEDV